MHARDVEDTRCQESDENYSLKISVLPSRGVSSNSRACACIWPALMRPSFEVYCMRVNLVFTLFLTGAKNLSMLKKLRYL